MSPCGGDERRSRSSLAPGRGTRAQDESRELPHARRGCAVHVRPSLARPPPLSAAVRSNSFVVPLFVRDAGISAVGFDAPNRRAFLADCLQDLDQGLRKRGGRLILRTGEVVEQVCKVVADAEADEVHMAAGASAYARAREERLRRALEREGTRLYVHEAVTTALAPGAVTPSGSDHFAVFTAYFRRWSQRDIRTTLGAPRRVQVPVGIHSEKLPERKDVTGVSPGLASGGEEEGRRGMASWLGNGIAQYEERHDGLAADATSRLSAHLHFGTLAAAELVHRARSTGGEGAEAYVRQLCWRDFHHQVLAARPLAAVADYRTRGIAGVRRARPRRTFRHGRRGEPAIRWSTQRCGSCVMRAGCTTAAG